MFTKTSWRIAGGYPEFAGALDTWGFGFRQLVTKAKMMVMPNSYYYHRYGYESYWFREAKKGKASLTALQIVLSFLDLLEPEDVDYIMSPAGRNVWFEDLDQHPLKLKNSDYGKTGQKVFFRKRTASKVQKFGKYIPAKLRPLARGVHRLLLRNS
jgi:hypothetical protein